MAIQPPDGGGFFGLGPGFSIGAVITAIGTGFLALRKYLSQDAVSTAANAAQTDLINLLRSEIASQRDRADKAEAARDATVSQFNTMKDQIYDLTQEVKRLRQQIGPSLTTPPVTPA